MDDPLVGRDLAHAADARGRAIKGELAAQIEEEVAKHKIDL